MPSTDKARSTVANAVAITLAASLATGTGHAAAAATEEPKPIDEIVVTATRSQTLASKTPVSITAVGQESLISNGVTNPTQLADLVPTLSIDRQNGLQITIRGVTSTDNTEKGDPSAGFLLDDVFIARAQAQEVSFFDLERVEVLRGPQGTLYGRNTTAGLINLITARPKKGVTQATLDVATGNYGQLVATGALNLPVGERSALRAAFNVERRDSFLNPGPSTFDLGPFKDNVSGRLTFATELADNIDLVLRGDYSQIQGRPTNIVLASNFYQLPFRAPVAGQPGIDPTWIGDRVDSGALRTLAFREPRAASRDNSTWGLQAELSWRFGERYTATWIGSYREFERDELLTGFSGSVLSGANIVTNNVLPQTFDGSYDQNSQELRLAYDGDRLDLQGGLYYFREASSIEFFLFGSQGFQPGQRGFVFGFPQDPTISKSVGYFAQGTYSLTDALRLTAGVRLTQDDKSRVGATVFRANPGDPLDFTTATQPGSTNPRNVRDSLNNADVSYEETTWRLGLDYDLNAASLLYATISTGYKAGGFNDGCLAGTPNCFGGAIRPAEALFYEPETLTAYEAGLKTRVLDDRLRLTAAVFRYDYKNLQLSNLSSICGGPCQVTTNAGEAEVSGIELDGVFRVNDRHTVDASVAWLDAAYTDYLIAPGVQFAGRSLDRSPEWTLIAGYTYTHPFANGGSLALGVRSRYSDEFFLLAPPVRAQFRQPSFTKTDLLATYTAPNDRWYVQAFVKNLEDEVTVSSVALPGAFPGQNNGTVQFADPQLYGLRAGFRFQ